MKLPLGQYNVTVNSAGFATGQQAVVVTSDSVQELHFALTVAAHQESLEVTAEPAIVDPSSSTPESLVSRSQIAQVPGADRTNALSMITDFVPGATVVHDQLHVRGGHQVTWAIDGIPVPNTNIASNVGPQFDPKDIDTLEVERGSFSADSGTVRMACSTSLHAPALSAAGRVRLLPATAPRTVLITRSALVTTASGLPLLQPERQSQ